ncbi:MAG: zinc ribbon domain-containing protein [Asgard group archaeon]|nr:zinc ribbon domain-containing protein [Asgard group archaeon]
MEKQYCVSCGAAIAETDSFCFKCGSSVETTKTIQEVHNASLVSQVSEEAPQRRTRKIKRHGKKIVFIPILILMILVPVIVISSVSHMQKPLGTLTYDVPDSGITSIDLTISNDIGSVDIIYDDSISNLFEAVITVRGGLRASFDDAVNFNHEIIGDRININFFHNNELRNLFRMKQLNHEIDILMNPTATVDFDIQSATGSVSVEVEFEDDLVIENLSLESSTGSAKFYGNYLNNLTLGDVSLSSSTGSIVFDLEDSTNTYLTGLILHTSTGSVTADLGEYLTLDCSTVSLDTSTGSVTLAYSNIIHENNVYWSLSTSTGSVNLFIEQTILSPTNASMDFVLDTSTGSVTTYCELDSEIGIEIDADTSTGSITLPNGNDYYVSSDFALKAIQYSFVLTTSTGSITANVVN